MWKVIYGVLVSAALIMGGWAAWNWYADTNTLTTLIGLMFKR